MYRKYSGAFKKEKREQVKGGEGWGVHGIIET